jgi:HTH-type transcriptional regulator/antitoxin MqsA
MLSQKSINVDGVAREVITMSDSRNICPICEEGRLHEQLGKNSVDYKGHSGELDLHFSVCEACGSEQADASQLRVNKRAVIAFRKRVDGLLSGAEVRAIRERLGINQAEAARIFGGGPVAFSKYETNDVAQSEAMDKLLRLVAELPEALGCMKRRADVPEVKDGEWISAPMDLPHRGHHVLKVVSSSYPEPEQAWRKRA